VPVVDLVFAQDQTRLLHHALAVEDAVVFAQVQIRGPGFEHHVISGQATVGLVQAELEHVAVEVAQGSVFAHQLNRHQLALHGFELDAGIVAQDVNVELKVA
jgi:hypothetical protein